MAIFAYVKLRGADTGWAIIGFAAVIIGLSLGHYLNEIRESNTSFVVFNFLDAIDQYGGNNGRDSITENMLSLPVHLKEFLAEYLVPQVPFTRTYPMLMVYWLAIFSITFLAFQRKQHSIALAAVLLAMAFALPSLFSIRGYLYQYRIYVEIWVILSAMISIDKVAALENFRKRIVINVIALSVIIPGFQVSFDLIKPAAANTREPIIVCPMMIHTPLIAKNLSLYCDKARRDKYRKPQLPIPSFSRDETG